MPDLLHPGLRPILDHLLDRRGVDFSGYQPAMLERRVRMRLSVAGCDDFSQYFACLMRDPGEIDRLLDMITINVSRFFRDSLTFELLADRILPALVRDKARVDDASLRVWSAGCARGEEAYSVAILIRELQEKEGRPEKLHFFATDIDANVLLEAGQAVYAPAAMQNVKYRLLNKYFAPCGESFCLAPDIRRMVSFSTYDMLDKRCGAPPDSVFGDFDLILCRNLLIYFNLNCQERIFDRLYRALAPGGRLVLGLAEAPPASYQGRFSQVFEYGPIYRKQ